MSIARSILTGGTGYVTYNSANFFTREKIDLDFAPTWDKVTTSHFGPVDAVKKNLVLKIPLRLWGAWENLAILFPSYAMNPIPGASIFGTTDVPLVIQARNNDRITYANAQLTKLAALYLGVDNDLFAADVEFTALIKNSANPEDAGSYHVRDTNAYADATAAFAKTNFKRNRFALAWAAITGFTAITAQKGTAVSWDLQTGDVPCDGLGVVDMRVKSMVGQAKLIALQPTLAQLKTNSQEESAHGTLASTISGDLTCTGNNSGPVVVLKNAYLKSNKIVFDDTELRVGEAIWETTRGFTTGVPQVAGSVA